MNEKNFVEVANVNELAKAFFKEQNRLAMVNSAKTLGVLGALTLVGLAVEGVRKSEIFNKLKKKTDEEVVEETEE